MADQGPLVFVDPDNEQIKLADNVELHFGSGADAQDEGLYDIAMRWDGTDFDVLQGTADSSIKWGVDGAGIDHVFYGDTASAALTWDQSADALIFSGAAQLQFAGTAGIAIADDNLIRLGSSNDVTLEWDTAATPDQLIMLPAADDTLWTIGNGTVSMDVQLFGNSAGAYVYWDASADLLYTTGADLQFKDSDYLVFGTGAGAAGDVSITWDSTNLVIAAAADDSVIEFGDAAATQLSFDLKVYGNASNGADYLLWDASASALTTVGAAVIRGRTNDANGLGLQLSTWATTGDVSGTTGTPTGAIVYNVADKTIQVFDGAAWVATAALT